MPPENPLSEISLSMARFAEIFAPLVNQVQAMMLDTANQLRDSLLPVFTALAEAGVRLKKLPDELKPAISEMAKRGWYISAEMGISELQEFRSAIESEDFEHLDDSMQSWIDAEIENILRRACRQFPNRQSIISSAIRAHISGDFSLSVPVLLIQTEGMCIETFGVKLFSTNNGIPAMRSVVEDLIDSPLSEVFLLPMQEQFGITAKEKIRHQFPEAPNRHEILHGIDTGYMSRKTSSKALSLLEYFLTVVIPPEKLKL